MRKSMKPPESKPNGKTETKTKKEEKPKITYLRVPASLVQDIIGYLEKKPIREAGTLYNTLLATMTDDKGNKVPIDKKVLR